MSPLDKLKNRGLLQKMPYNPPPEGPKASTQTLPYRPPPGGLKADAQTLPFDPGPEPGSALIDAILTTPDFPIMGVTEEGRPAVLNMPGYGRDGEISTEITRTVEDPRINAGRATNIPTLFNSLGGSLERAIQTIAENDGVDPETGRRLPGYRTPQDAVEAARARSNGLGDELRAKLMELLAR